MLFNDSPTVEGLTAIAKLHRRFGSTGFPYLFNAMSPLGGQAPGVVSAALESHDTWRGLIVHGAHVSPVVLRLALRCRRVDRFMLVSDAMPCV